MTTQLDHIASRVAAPDRMGQATAVEQARAVAEVQARVIVAQQCPRSVDAAVRAMREACAQMPLAERAFYAYPRGKDKNGKPIIISGPSVHLARELARVWGNCEYSVNELRRDDKAGQSEMLAYAWDLETNTRNSAVFIVPHFRDRSGGTPQQLTDMRDIYETNANNGARRVREAIFNVLPVWFTEEAKELCTKTLANGGGKPLAQRVADAIEAFEKIGVKVAQLEARTGAGTEDWTPQDVAQLGILITSIRRNEIGKDEAFPPADRGVTAADIGAAPAQAANGNGGAQAPAEPASPPATEQGTLDAPPPAERPLSTEPGSSTSDQQKRLWGAFTDLGFKRDDKTEARQACEAITGRKFARGTMDDLSEAEAEALAPQIEALADRSALVALLAEKAGGSQ
jgi:hypothetical protein